MATGTFCRRWVTAMELFALHPGWRSLIDDASDGFRGVG